MKRRLFASTALVVPLGLLSACGNSTQPPGDQLTNAITVGQTIDQALFKIVTDVANPPISLISPTVEEAVLAGLGLAGTGLRAFLSQSLPPANAATLDQINAYFTIALNTVAPVLTIALPAATPVVLALEAVDALLPVFEAAIPPAASTSVAASRATSGRIRVHAASEASGMTADQALHILHTYLGGK